MLTLAESESGALVVPGPRFDDEGRGPTSSHPLSAWLPCLDGRPAYVETELREGARFAFLDPNLRLPGEGGSDPERLLTEIARTTKPGRSEAAAEARFVEPGVGRSYLLDGLTLAGRSEYKDFAATGVGLTPYSEGGFVAIGRHLDGRVALTRARLRQRNADRLEALGCRAAPVVAIVILPEQWVDMLDGSRSPAVIAVRAFRSVLRVKQIDPVAAFYHSMQDSAQIGSILLESALPLLGKPGESQGLHHALAISRLAHGFEQYCAAGDDLARILGVVEHPLHSAEQGIAQSVRRRVIAAYAPILLELGARRFEDGREGLLELAAYVTAFAASLGDQLARMYEGRFLHDYHHPGVERYHPGWLYTLVENNVTIAAEFADLETGIFVDDVEEAADSLQISRSDVELLQHKFELYHMRDFEQARRIVRTLAAGAVLADPKTGAIETDALASFDAAYAARKFGPSL